MRDPRPEPLRDAPAEPLRIAPVAYAAAAGLIAELDADLGVRYGGEGDPVHAPAAEFDGPGGQMLLATRAGATVGCVGLRRISPDIAELKRMYVRPGLRRRGIARALLAACEQAAVQLGYEQLWLETGTLQPEAVALYRSAGYQPVASFGQYADAHLSVHLGRAIRLTPIADVIGAVNTGRCDSF